MQRSTTRENILQAANRVIQRHGVAGLTLEAVAREAGVSKGGIFYHFPSKDALIEGMMASLCQSFDRALQQEAERSPAAQPGRWLHAYILATCLPEVPPADVGGLLAAVATNPALLEPLRDWYAAWQQRVEQDGLPAATATLLRLAVDGWWFTELLGLAPPQGALRQQVIDAMLSLTDEHTSRDQDVLS
jgi:AcrR family transcriptional regulator